MSLKDLKSIPHSSSIAQISKALNVDFQTGLTEIEASRRLKSDGFNAIEEKQPSRLLHFVVSQFSSVVVWLLAFAALIAWVTGNEIEALAILVVLILNAIIGFAIEWQAGRALEALRKTTHTDARVRRDAREKVIDASEIVIGDIISLTAGDRTPADARILESYNLRTDESTLTGESLPVDKNVEAVEQKTPLAERTSMLFLGTTVVAGHALAVVTSTGRKTELGQIGHLVSQAEQGQTPLEKKLANLGKRLVYVVLGISLVVLLAGILRGEDLWLMLEVSISLAVAAVPEGLPAVTTLILALGVLRMARRNAIVRRLSAVETLGSSTVICTDKTGTLTENRMTVQEYRLASGRLVKLESVPSKTAESSFRSDELKRLLLVSTLCNEATFDENAVDAKQAIGDPTETALLIAAKKCGFDPSRERSDHRVLFEQPFDADTKRMTVVIEDVEKKQFAAMKGAPAVVLKACGSFFDEKGRRIPFDQQSRERFLETNREMANRTLRVLALAEKKIETGSDFENDIADEFTFLGFIGMSDPPRRGAAEAIREAQNAGIRVVMLTGDQINTARAIAHKLRIGGTEMLVLHSSDLLESDEKQFTKMAIEADVFARVTPEDKLRIVKALQKTGEIVAVTGDGVNDAPALKHADIGVAMGKRGTEVAKEASDIVLTDDNFKTIVDAIEGGRTIYSNITKFVHMMFSHNLGEVLVIFGAIIAGLPLPLLPLQILWINLVTDVFPALALAVEPPSPKTMLRKPQSPSEALLSNRFMLLIFWQGAMLAAIALGAYLWALNQYGEGAHSRTVALLAVIGVQLGHLFNCRSRTRSVFSRFFSNPYIFVAAAIVILLQILAVYWTPLAKILNVTQPTLTDWFVVGLCIILPILVVELTKLLARNKTVNNKK